jgi:tRNA(fMet)-specific endonuclease VapC
VSGERQPVAFVLLDTNVVSFLMRGGTRADAWRKVIGDAISAVSFVTVGELHQGALLDSWGAAKRDNLDAEIRKYVVVPFDARLSHEWARVRFETRHRTIPENDAWIAATARLHGLPLVTDDRKHFGNIADLELRTLAVNRA